jgi:hypothetical protein
MTTLNDDLLTVFDRACQESNWEVAEHLLRALETVSRRERSDEHVENAYVELVRTFNRNRCH